MLLELAVVLAAITVLASLLHYMKQPPVIAYIIIGLLFAPYISEIREFKPMAEIGIALLLFIVGLNLNLKSINRLGKESLLVGVGQVVLCWLVGFGLSLVLGYGLIEGIILSLAFTFSSTVIDIKMLGDRGHLNSLYGQIVVGVLLVQDLVSIIAIIILGAGNPVEGIVGVFLSIGAIVFVVWLIAKKIAFSIVRFFADSTETLFLFGISYALLFSVMCKVLGLPLEVGALAAGVSLSGVPYVREISSKIKPLRDFFILIFFVYLGVELFDSFSSIDVSHVGVFTFLISIITIGIVYLLLVSMGHAKRTAFFSGVVLSQVSEFSFIFLSISKEMGLITKETFGTAVATGLVTIILSVYFYMHAERIFQRIKKMLPGKERKEKLKKERTNALLIGYRRTGYGIARALYSLGFETIIVDHDPNVLEKPSFFPVVFGDIGDEEFLNDIKPWRMKIVISTIQDKEINYGLIKKIRRKNKKTIIIASAETVTDALELYNSGVDYVILPQIVGGFHTAELIHKIGAKKREFRRIRDMHIHELKKMLEEVK